MPFEPMTKTPKPRSQKVNAPKAFPASETQESRGRTRFGPAPKTHGPAVKNIFNTDPFGRDKPGQEK
jgi:hypothetical protein